MKRFLKAFKFAFNGLIFAFKKEKNFKFHIFVTIFVVILSFIFKINKIEWLFILSAIFFVLVCELINTAIEKILDLVDNNYNEKIKIIKDISAGFVLLVSLYAFIVGILIFFKYLFNLK